MTTEQNKAIVRRFYAAMEANDQATFNELLSPDLVVYTPGAQTREMMLQGINMWHAAFESHFTIVEEIAEETRSWSAAPIVSSTIEATFRAFPSGKQGEAESFTIERLREGKIVERRVFSDWLGLMEQLGLVPPPQSNK